MIINNQILTAMGDYADLILLQNATETKTVLLFNSRDFKII